MTHYPTPTPTRYSTGQRPLRGDVVRFWLDPEDELAARRVIDVELDGRVILKRPDGTVSIPVWPDAYELVDRTELLGLVDTARRAQEAMQRFSAAMGSVRTTSGSVRTTSSSSSTPSCVVCDDLGCEHCPAVGATVLELRPENAR